MGSMIWIESRIEFEVSLQSSCAALDHFSEVCIFYLDPEDTYAAISPIVIKEISEDRCYQQISCFLFIRLSLSVVYRKTWESYRSALKVFCFLNEF